MGMSEECGHTYIAETPLLVGDSCESRDPSLWVAIAGKSEVVVLSISEMTVDSFYCEKGQM
jgi:hypothetical protein